MSQGSYISYQMSKYRSAQRMSQALTGDAVDAEAVFKETPQVSVRANLPTVMKGALRAQLRQLGLNESVATLAIMMGPMLPRTTDADSAGVKAIVRGFQRWFGLSPTGYLDIRTAAVLKQICGPTWFDMNWASLVSHVLAAPRGMGRLLPLDVSLASVGETEMPGTTKWGLLLGIATGFYFLSKWVK